MSAGKAPLERPTQLIAPDTYLLSEYRLVNMFLAVGEKRAALIDTGGGIGPLREDVRALTDLPLVVLLTHGDPDHWGGAGAFGEAYLHEADWDGRGYPLNNAGRAWFVKTRAPVRNPDHVDEILALIPQEELPRPKLLPLHEGDVFDLGGRALEVLASPGHSPGSVCFLDRERRLLFAGDTANPSMALMPGDLQQYHDTMAKLWARNAEYDLVCRGHEIPAVCGKEVIQGYYEITGKLLSGQAQAKAEPDPIRIGKVYREGGLEIWVDCEA